MSIIFETEVCTSWFGRPKLVIRSSHLIIRGKLQNMLFRKSGSPMLDIADAMELRARLDEFIKRETAI